MGRGGKKKLLGGWGSGWNMRKDFPNFLSTRNPKDKTRFQTADTKMKPD